jgi:hypothetical protein
MNVDRLFHNESVPRVNPFPYSVPVNPSVSKISFSSISTLKPIEGSLNRLQCNEGYCFSICQKIAKIWKAFSHAIFFLFSAIYQRIRNCFAPSDVLTLNSKEALQKIYWGLGKENKWREYIDGTCHHLGKDVFDKGLHPAGTAEPGFAASMEKACVFIGQSLGKKMDADWYLQLHKHTCSHFSKSLNDAGIVLMGQEKVGVFRDLEDRPNWKSPGGVYAFSKEAKREFEALDAEVKKEFGPSYGMGVIDWDENAIQGGALLAYKPMTRAQVRRVFNKFLNEFYSEVEKARTPDEKLWAIAKYYQRQEWLHSTRDGAGRTDMAVLNKLLVEYGFHPAILEYPYVSSCYTLQRWKDYLQKGLVKWEQERCRIHPFYL